MRLAHPILSARVAAEPGGLAFQHVGGLAETGFEHSDLRAADDAAYEEAVRRAVFEERARPFDLEGGPLVRFHVLERSAAAFDLLVAEHHAALDGYSLNAMVAELVARCRGEPVETADDLAVLRALATEQAAADASPATRAFWTGCFAGLAPPSPLCRPRSAGTAAEMRQIDVVSSRPALAAARACAGRLDVSLKALFFALHARAVALAAGAAAPSLGAVFSLRPGGEGAELALGMFLNVLPVPVEAGDIAASARAFDRFEREVFAHKAVSGEALAAWAGPHAEMDSIFNFIQFAQPEAGDVRHAERRFFAVDALMPLAVDWDVSADRLNLGFQYDARRLGEDFADALAAALAAGIDDLFRLSESTATDPLEAAVTAALARIVGRAPAPDERLAALGLQSLQMVLLAGLLQEQVGRLPDLAGLLRARTVREVARHLRSGARSARPEVSFVRLSAPAARGAAVRVIAFPPVGAAPSVYDPWCDRLPAGVELHALRYPDFSAPYEIDLAAFVDLIVEQAEPLADRPVVLVGASFGAALAFWAAHRLCAAAKGLAAIAAAAPKDELPAFNYHLLSDEALKAELERTKLVPAAYLKDSADLTPIMKALRGMSRIAAAGGSIPAGPLACPIVALYPTGDATVSRDDMDAWRRLTAGRFALVQCRGGHSVLMDEPHMLLESAGLSDLLEQARSA